MKRWVLQASLCAGTTACVAGEWWRSTTDTREQPFSLLSGRSATFFCAAAPTSPDESDEHVISSSHKQEEGEDGPTMPLRLELVQVITRHGLRTPISIIPADKTSVWRCPHEQLSVLTLNTSSASPQATEGGKKEEEEEEEEEPRLELLHNREKHAFLEDVVPLHHLYRRKYEEGRQKLRGNCHMGQLTSEGLLQMKELGEKMRERYVERLRFLSPQLHKRDLYVRSTATNRTFESAQSLLWGLYPPWTRPSGKGGMMTIHMIESRMENMYPRSGCANLTKWIKQTRESKASVQRSVEHATWKKQLEAALDKTVNSWSALNSTLQSMQAHGHEFPPGLTLEMAQRVREEADWHTLLKFEQERVCRLGIGRFVQDVLQHAQRVVEPQTAEGATERQKKFLLYSGHDNTLSPFLSAFRVFDGRQPPMASAIVIETFVDAKGKHWVRFVYNGKDMLLGGNEPDEYLIDSYHASSSAHQQCGENGKETKQEEQETEKVEQQEQNAEHKKEEEVETEEQMKKREKKEKKKRKQAAKAHEQQLEREAIRKQEKSTRIPTRGKHVLAQVIVEQEEKKQDGNDNDVLTIVTERMVLSPFDEYKARAERMIPSDYDKECEANLD
ncbi:Steryl ester hydrolase [Balamuthia mandrillaris]